MWWLALGAPGQVVFPTLALCGGVVGAAAMVGRFLPRGVLVPAILVLALTLMPGVLPTAVHPLTPTQHPMVVSLVLGALWPVGALVHVLPQGTRVILGHFGTV
ncbi:hypothetical protein ACQB6R_00530 [Propionibacteriaceae bacterium G1746]|uniref:hypothetical protein n=1 Tax=Aestuariimicrobium sp. G57 TaxID=3418485 RepID=UPI003C14046B